MILRPDQAESQDPCTTPGNRATDRRKRLRIARRALEFALCEQACGDEDAIGCLVADDFNQVDPAMERLVRLARGVVEAKGHFGPGDVDYLARELARERQR
jgi:hypothetical protein